ncbi:unnamed protein product, partial [Iphiclides podalirius]
MLQTIATPIPICQKKKTVIMALNQATAIRKKYRRGYLIQMSNILLKKGIQTRNQRNGNIIALKTMI